MRIAALQMVSTTDPAHNCETARRLVAQAAADGAELAVLPEYFCLMGRRDTDKLAIAETPGDGPIQRMLSQAALEHGVWLRTEHAGRVLNSNCVYAPDGRLCARYDKIHLFRYDNGRERYDEGHTIQPGVQPQAFTAGALRVGLSVCYDLRFPELYRALMRPPCELLSVPAAFTHTTGLAHWELLLRARAVENQCYVIAAAQGGEHDNGRRTFGHSMVVDPWGKVLGVLEQGEGVVLADVDLEQLAGVRRQLPALEHRVPSVQGFANA